MKVLLLIDALGSGGAERQMTYLAISMKKAGCEIRLIQFYDSTVFYSQELAQVGIKVEICTDGLARWRRPWVIAKLVRGWHPDTVIAYKGGCCQAACLAELLGKHFKLIVSERNTTQVLNLRERLKFSLYRLADYVVPNSYAQGEFIKRHFPRLVPRLQVITNMIDTDKFCPASESPRNTEGIPVVITTARISPQKNVTGYLQALQLLRQRGVKATFVWYGGSNSEDTAYENEVKHKVRELGLEDYIHFAGRSNQIARLYREAAYFCLPSLYEGFANVLCEAMASGLVCVASNVCDNPLILNHQDRLFDPNNPVDMADKIETMLGMSENEYRVESFANRERILKLCSPEMFLDSYLKLCSE